MVLGEVLERKSDPYQANMLILIDLAYVGELYLRDFIDIRFVKIAMGIGDAIGKNMKKNMEEQMQFQK